MDICITSVRFLDNVLIDQGLFLYGRIFQAPAEDPVVIPYSDKSLATLGISPLTWDPCRQAI